MDIKKILFKTNTIDVEKALPDAIVFCNKDGKIQWVNDKAAEVFETSKMHLLTSNIADFIENALHMISTVIDGQEQIIDLIFRQKYAFQNTNADVVKLKTITLNLYYSTYIRATTKLATGILQIQNLDARLQNGDLTLVDDVANVLSRRNYSFATKYCACHNPKAYPIYDKIVADYLAKVIVKGNLKGYHATSLTAAKKIMKNYMDYVAIYNAFIKQYKLKRLSYREVDWYIWTTCKCGLQNLLTTLI